jgi:predicted GNAT family acetyltransferase
MQMVADRLSPIDTHASTRRLEAADYDEMSALVGLTRPGPFGPRALEMGSFHGIFDGQRLVALAGSRLRLDGYREVATVCTHPDYRGRNYGKAVVSAVAKEMAAEGLTPFLGVISTNTPAIRLYERLGFTHRMDFYISSLKRV